jgi:hypothetical protein
MFRLLSHLADKFADEQNKRKNQWKNNIDKNNGEIKYLVINIARS